MVGDFSFAFVCVKTVKMGLIRLDLALLLLAFAGLALCVPVGDETEERPTDAVLRALVGPETNSKALEEPDAPSPEAVVHVANAAVEKCEAASTNWSPWTNKAENLKHGCGRRLRTRDIRDPELARTCNIPMVEHQEYCKYLQN